jgi:hypothetical protein
MRCDVKIELLQNLNITGIGQRKAGSIVDVNDFVGKFYVGLGVAIEHKPTPLPTQTPSQPAPTPAPTPTSPNAIPSGHKPVEQPYPKVDKQQGPSLTVSMPTKPVVPEKVNHAVPEPKAKALPKPMLPGEEIMRDSGPLKN